MGGGLQAKKRFWKIQRGGGVIRQIPSMGGGGYGYFLEPHITVFKGQIQDRWYIAAFYENVLL